MNALICPACGCSLVRLGIGINRAVVYEHNGEKCLFCCKDCLDVFLTAPEKYLQEVSDLAVCPTCLAEKPLEATVELEYNGALLRFCRCPHCIKEFERNPEYYIKRLAGLVDYPGVFGETFCCDE